MTETIMPLGEWRKRRQEICAAIAEVGCDPDRLLPLARDLVALEEVRPTGNGARKVQVLRVVFDGFAFEPELSHPALERLRHRQHALLLSCLERVVLSLWQRYFP